MLPVALVVHGIPNRTRLRVSTRKHDGGYFATLVEKLASVDHVHAVSANPLSGSVLIEHEGLSLPQLSELGRSLGLFELARTRRPPLSVRKGFELALHEAGQLVQRGSGQRVDGATLLALGIAALGVRQMLRGDVLPAGWALCWQALSLLQPPEAQARAHQETDSLD